VASDGGALELHGVCDRPRFASRTLGKLPGRGARLPARSRYHPAAELQAILRAFRDLASELQRGAFGHEAPVLEFSSDLDEPGSVRSVREAHRGVREAQDLALEASKMR
jgi:hypothetical protein